MWGETKRNIQLIRLSQEFIKNSTKRKEQENSLFNKDIYTFSEKSMSEGTRRGVRSSDIQNEQAQQIQL